MGFKEAREQLMADPETAERVRGYVRKNHEAVALADLRQGRVTQAELAHVLGVSQRRVSAIEHAPDIQISTLRSYLEKLGFGMEIAALSATGERIPLQIGES